MDARLLLILLAAACSKAPSPEIPRPAPGAMTPIISATLRFAGPEPMKNTRDTAFAFGDFCAGEAGGIVEVLSILEDGGRVILRYHAPTRRGQNISAGEDLNAEREKLDCPDQAPIIADLEEWSSYVREARVRGQDSEKLREAVRKILKDRTAGGNR